jgi:hypothetical protein
MIVMTMLTATPAIILNCRETVMKVQNKSSALFKRVVDMNRLVGESHTDKGVYLNRKDQLIV